MVKRWVTDNHFTVFHFLRAPGGEKYRWRATREACEGKISEMQIAEVSLDSYERVGPAELRK
jgi:hypothetical protein